MSGLITFRFSLYILTDISLKGVPMQGITEISGEAGSGKTQLCLSIAVQVKLLTNLKNSLILLTAIVSSESKRKIC